MNKAIEKRGWIFVLWLVWVGLSDIYRMGLALMIVYSAGFEHEPVMFAVALLTLINWWSLLRIWYYRKIGFYIYLVTHIISVLLLLWETESWWVLPGGLLWPIITWFVIRPKWPEFK